MIKLQNYTPDVYYKESRDFQFIGRLFDLVLNYVKTNADLLYDLPFSDNSDDQFIALLTLTLGFEPKHKYVTKHLRAVCSCLSEILRNKGTVNATLIACKAIFNAEGIYEDVSYELTNRNTNFILYLPPALADTTLLNDIFNYILPAGMSCQIIKVTQFNEASTTALNIESKTLIYPRELNQNKDYFINTEDEYIANVFKPGEEMQRPGISTDSLFNTSIYKPDTEDDD